MTRLALALFLGCLALPASANELRAFTLADGREVAAIVHATEATGMRIEVPQGQMSIGFEDLVDMQPITGAQYLEQPPWWVVVAPEAYEREAVVEALGTVPGVQVHGHDGASAPLEAEQIEALAACGVELDCMVAATEGAPWLWLVTGVADGSDLILQGAVSTGSTRTRVRTRADDPERLGAAAYDILDVSRLPEPTVVHEDDGGDLVVDLADTDTETPVHSPRPPASTAARFLPVPGLPALLEGDATRFALAAGTVLPATAGWTTLAGSQAQSAPEHALMTLGGYYVLTVAANHLFAPQGPTLTVEPARDGATLRLRGRLR